MMPKHAPKQKDTTEMNPDAASSSKENPKIYDQTTYERSARELVRLTRQYMKLQASYKGQVKELCEFRQENKIGV